MHRKRSPCNHPEIRDYGGETMVFNIDHATKMNDNFRFALWTGNNMQLTLMSIPAGSWHNIINVGSCPLKLYSIYAPPQHPFGTVHKTKAEAEQSEY